MSAISDVRKFSIIKTTKAVPCSLRAGSQITKLLSDLMMIKRPVVCMENFGKIFLVVKELPFSFTYQKLYLFCVIACPRHHGLAKGRYSLCQYFSIHTNKLVTVLKCCGLYAYHTMVIAVSQGYKKSM